ncbi:MucB/RseB C-terminal domain-containing protein [Oceanicoccus sagamiensis]|uniref:Transcriptional regulator n=1 Tax=Oceanicoccus sagamiensis TaxID=716816 RepID=A0A1X9NN85_9GAMM|nr:MucB/RseB C-terminal domain-containing protein [Oceanicoccus sagamiensis]ARN75353.1 hypothetical protein BST96_15270 [Oceanicoccus sagamiensis]
MSLFSLLTILLLLISPALSLAAESDPRLLLDKMSHSFMERNYQGTFSFQRGDSIESLRIAHAVIDGKEYERLEYMDGDKREIIRRGHKLDCIHPGHQLVRFYQHQQNLKTTTQNASLDDYYTFTVTGMDRVAGRATINLTISPKDTHRFGYRLSLDKASGLLLRSELIGPKDKVLERFQYVEIHLNAKLTKQDFAGAQEAYHPDHAAPVAARKAMAAGDQHWKVQWLPGGFTSTVANQNFVTEDDMATFTDGMTVFSVFLERESGNKTPSQHIEGHAQKGATTAYSRAIDLSGSPHRVTVVGEIPAKTAQQIARSIALVKP